MTGNRIKQIREVLKYTQKEFGKKLGISQTMISKYEKGFSEVNRTLLEKIAKNFDISINCLILGQGEMFINKNIPNSNINSHSTPEEIIESITNELKKIDDSKLLDYVNVEIKAFVKRQKMKKEDGVILNLI